MAGIGVGAAEILPAMEQMAEFELVAAADVNPRVLETFRRRYGAKTYGTVETMCADPDVEAVWVSTPNRFHAPHTIIAANAGKHVVVEKPMALSLQEAENMIEASIKNKIKLLCGHTQSFGPHIRTMRKIIRSGALGPLCALHVWAYTDWMLRPRTADQRRRTATDQRPNTGSLTRAAGQTSCRVAAHARSRARNTIQLARAVARRTRVPRSFRG